MGEYYRHFQDERILRWLPKIISETLAGFDLLSFLNALLPFFFSCIHSSGKHLSRARNLIEGIFTAD